MLYVRIELWPRGDRSKAELRGEAHIVNDGAGTPAVGHYVARLFKRGTEVVWRGAKVRGFPRQRLGVWDLLFRALRALVGERNDGGDSGHAAVERDWLVDQVLAQHDWNHRVPTDASRRQWGLSSATLAVLALTAIDLGYAPNDASDLALCEHVYATAPEHLRPRMLPRLEEFRARIAKELGARHG